MKKRFAILAACAVLGGAASATELVFKGDGNNVLPTTGLTANGLLIPNGDNAAQNCGSVGTDFCSEDHTIGLTYELDGRRVTVRAFVGPDADNLTATRLIQDLQPTDSGLGAFSETNNADDQTQADSMEWIEFDFGLEEVTVRNVEFNAGGDVDCTNFGSEGPCGGFNLTIFDALGFETFAGFVDITNIDVLPLLGTGSRFLLQAVGDEAGFVVARLTVGEIPVPGAIPLMISGLAGLGFATRRRKARA